MRCLCLAMILLVVGCGKEEEKTTVPTEEGKTTIERKGDTTTIKRSDGTEVKVKSDGRTTRIETKGGTLTTGEDKLPPGFPLPMMPQAKVQQSTHLTPADEPEVFQVFIEVPASVQEAAAFYEQALKDKGLTVERIETKGDPGDQVALTGQAGRIHSVVVVSREPGAQQTTAAMTWTIEKEVKE